MNMRLHVAMRDKSDVHCDFLSWIAGLELGLRSYDSLVISQIRITAVLTDK